MGGKLCSSAGSRRSHIGRSGQLWADTRWYDCEDRVGSLMVMGCGLVTAGVTHGLTGDAALLRHVRSWLPAPARAEELA